VIETRILGPADDPTHVARDADAGVLGIAGGDGSLRAVAEVALARDVPFVAVPFGTRNHFARDLGLDRDDPSGAGSVLRV
jgi:diacylglycerol kinase family enzyme